MRRDRAWYREINEIMWTCWADSCPAYVKQRHYQRGLRAFLRFSGNGIALDGRRMRLQPHRARAPLHPERNFWRQPSDGGVVSGLPKHVKVDVPCCIEVMNYFRCPTVMGPGKARQWGLSDRFDNLTGETVSMFAGRGIAVLPAEQWIDTRD
eukprot:436377-Pyramimonas_sp.AAC.1